MAIKTWIGTTTDWATAANWSPSGVPIAGDEVVIDGRATQNIAGSDQSAVTLASLLISSSATITVGTASAPLQIGATLINLDLGAVQTAVTVEGGGDSTTGGLPPVRLVGTHASNTLTVLGGVVGAGVDTPGSVYTFAAVNVAGGRLVLGGGGTITAVSQSGGDLLLNAACTTLQQDAGTCRTAGTGAIATAHVGGTLEAAATGTLTTLNVLTAGLANFSVSPAARTVTNANVYGSGRVSDSWGAVAWTNGIDCLGGSKTTQVDFGTNVTVTPSSV